MHRSVLRVALSLVLLPVLVGCASLGVRPDEPRFEQSTCACQAYIEYVNYTKELQESYLARASQNRFWIYAAGSTAIGTTATVAGMAATSSASAGTLALTSIIGGSLSSFFAMADNSTLAYVYTVAANRLEKAIRDAESKLPGEERHSNQELCKAALDHLRNEVCEAKTTLESARTNSAVAALQRAKAQTQELNNLVNEIQAQNTLRIVPTPAIVQIEPTASVEKDQLVNLQVANVNLSSLGQSDVKLQLDGVGNFDVYWELPDPKTGEYSVKFRAPDRPVKDRNEYVPTLVIGRANMKIEPKSGILLKYK